MVQNTIIDAATLHRNKLRATRMDVEGANFLLRHVANDIALRLSTISREFLLALDFNSADTTIAEMLERSATIETVASSRPPAFATKLPFDLVAADDMLPIKNDSIDLIVSTLTLQMLNDIPGTLVQIRRALKPDGLFLGALLGGQTLHELRQSFLQAEAEITSSAQAHILPFMDVRDAGGLLQRAGFALPVTDSDTLTVRYDSAINLMLDLRAMGATNCLTNRSRKFLRRDVLARMIEIYARDFSDDDGRVRATFEVISLSGWAPHESQQKPLKPGSAKVRLADALKSSK